MNTTIVTQEQNNCAIMALDTQLQTIRFDSPNLLKKRLTSWFSEPSSCYTIDRLVVMLQDIHSISGPSEKIVF